MTSLKWQEMGEGFTAKAIMTPSDELMCWDQKEDKDAFCTRAQERRFDIAPIADDDVIVGVLTVGDGQTEPLTSKWLVSHDIGIPDLLALFAESLSPGFFAFHCQDVVGLVTPADLNRMPSRVYFYHLIGALEMTLGTWTRSRFRDHPQDILPLLSKNRQEELMEQQQTLVEGNVDIEIVDRLYLSDLLNIIRKQEDLRQELGLPSRSAAKRATSGLDILRNCTMHMVRPLIESVPDDLARVHRRAARARDLLQRLEQLS